jgi:hypothetical protein
MSFKWIMTVLVTLLILMSGLVANDHYQEYKNNKEWEAQMEENGRQFDERLAKTMGFAGVTEVVTVESNFDLYEIKSRLAPTIRLTFQQTPVGVMAVGVAYDSFDTYYVYVFNKVLWSDWQQVYVTTDLLVGFSEKNTVDFLKTNGDTYHVNYKGEQSTGLTSQGQFTSQSFVNTLIWELEIQQLLNSNPPKLAPIDCQSDLVGTINSEKDYYVFRVQSVGLVLVSREFMSRNLDHLVVKPTNIDELMPEINWGKDFEYSTNWFYYIQDGQRYWFSWRPQFGVNICDYEERWFDPNNPYLPQA